MSTTNRTARQDAAYSRRFDAERGEAAPRQPARPLRGVAYYRKSDRDDGESIAQQREWARAAALAEGIEIVREFEDQARPGWQTDRREDFHNMLAFCQAEAAAGRRIDVVVCWNPNRFSRADS